MLKYRQVWGPLFWVVFYFIKNCKKVICSITILFRKSTAFLWKQKLPWQAWLWQTCRGRVGAAACPRERGWVRNRCESAGPRDGGRPWAPSPQSPEQLLSRGMLEKNGVYFRGCQWRQWLPGLPAQVGSFLESLKHSRWIHHRGRTQALETSEVHHGVSTHRHVWEPLGSGIKPLAAQVDECRMHRRGGASVSQLWGIPQMQGVSWIFWRVCEIRALHQIIQNPKARNPQPTIKWYHREGGPLFESRTASVSLSFLFCKMGRIPGTKEKVMEGVLYDMLDKEEYPYGSLNMVCYFTVHDFW